MNADYYQIAGESSQKISGHAGLEYIKTVCLEKSKVLDVGCGEGTRLTMFSKSGWGVDLSSKAISLAKEKYPEYDFQQADATKLPFSNNTFDVVYSAFVLEHTLNPKKVISEMIRVCKPNGQVIILCPNYGAPNRRSPVSIENPYLKFITGIINPGWTMVTPKKNYDHIDDDTTFEPYILTILNFLKTQPIKILQSSTLWNLEAPSLNPRKLIMRLFPNFGPQIFIAVQKQ